MGEVQAVAAFCFALVVAKGAA